jgi:hypothetical protein
VISKDNVDKDPDIVTKMKCQSNDKKYFDGLLGT